MRAADRLAVARVVVGAEHAELGVARLHAPLELLQAPLVDGPERLDRGHLRPPCPLCDKKHRADSNRRHARCRRVPRRSATVLREPPRGLEPLRPGSKPGALPLSYGGGSAAARPRDTGGGSRTPMGRGPPASEAGASSQFRHARMQRRRLNRSTAARPSPAAAGGSGRALARTAAAAAGRHSCLERHGWYLPRRRRPDDARSSCATACAMSVGASVRTPIKGHPRSRGP